VVFFLLQFQYPDGSPVTPPPGYGFAPGYGANQFQPPKRNGNGTGCDNCNQPCFCIAQKGDQVC